HYSRDTRSIRSSATRRSADLALAADELESAATIGRKAAERAVSRLAPRQIATGQYPVLYSAEIARSLIGHLLGAASGGALYRRADRKSTRLNSSHVKSSYAVS